MPYSNAQGRPWLFERVAAHAPESMLDVGTGSGVYGSEFVDRFPGCRRGGIEVWEPYVERFGLTDLYHMLYVTDVRELDPLPAADVVICGDILEHMSTEDAVTVWGRARAAARKAVYLSIPIVHYPQGPWEGNPYEEHLVDDYSHGQVLDLFPGITAHWTGTENGVYEAVTT